VISALAITVTAVTDSKTYDGTTSSASEPTISPALAAGDSENFSQAFANKHVGTGKTIVPSGSVNDGNGGNNYAVTFANDTTGVISALAITVTAVTDSKTYDGTTSSAGEPTISPALAAGDSENFSQAFANKNVGTGKTIIPSGSVNDGNGGSNYAVTFANDTTGVISALAITVTAVTDSKTYDGTTTSAGEPTISPALAAGDSENFSQAFANKNVGTGKTIIPSGSVNDGNGGNNYAVTFANDTTGVISALAITVTAVSDNKTYDGTTTSAGEPTISPALAAGDSENFSQAFANRNAGTGKTLLPSGSVNDSNGGNNYAVTFANDTTGVITALTLTLTAKTDTKTYDGTTSSSQTPDLSAPLVGGDTGTFTQTYDNKNAGTGKTLTPAGVINDGNGGANYSLTLVSNNTGVINQAATSTAVASSANPSAFSTAVTFTATVSSAVETPTGSVIFTVDGTAQAPVTLNNGAASLSLSNLGIGAHSVSAAYTGNQNLSGSTSAALQQSVTQTGAKLVFSTQPSNADPNVVIAPAVSVTVQDASGNTVSSSNASITLALASGTGTLSGTLTVNAVNGVATFSNLKIDTVGSYTLSASATGLTGATSAAFSIVDTTPPVATSALTADTTTGLVGNPVTFSWAVTDASTVTYTWNFGDGTSITTTNPSATHTYSASNVYQVTVTATDANGQSVTSELTFTVAAAVLPPSDDICGGLNPISMNVKQVSAKLKFPSTLNKDALGIKTVIQLSDGFNPAGQVVEWQIGGIKGKATLTGKSSFISSLVKVGLKFKKPRKGEAFTARPATLSILMKGQALTDLKLGNVPVLNTNSTNSKGDASNVNICVVLTGHQAYRSDAVSGTYKAKKDKNGTFSAKFR
ncbi:MAG TPA: YDG domain-containing protein, partial [Planctomycetota bacterium]|nr:YDG domain-containing protein [Planctomycetota bacterium]